jgi:hypothetical protein
MADLSEAIKAARERKAKAEAAITDEDRQEQAQRAELAQLEREARAAEDGKRDLDLGRRLDAAQAACPDAKLKSIAPVEFTDTFIIRYSGKAHGDYVNETTRQMRREQSGQKADYVTARRTYALQVIIDWNGETAYDDLGNADLTRRLGKYLTDNPGLLTPITDAAGMLAGIVSEEKKRGG